MVRDGQISSFLGRTVFGIRVSTILVAFVIWTLVAVSFALRSYGWAIQRNIDYPFETYLEQTLTEFYLYGLLSPVVLWLGDRFPFEGGRVFRSACVHLVSAATFVVVNGVTVVLAVIAFEFNQCVECPPLTSLIVSYLTSSVFIHQCLLAYSAIVLVGHGLRYYRRSQFESLKVARLSSQLSEARLAALKMQIHPHFLFNTLNSIAALLKQDTDLAESMIARLSAFLRTTIHSSNESLVSLREELEFIKQYLSIEEVRFQDRLTVTTDIESSALNASVPNLILQPLVENSIKHGIAVNKKGGFIKIVAKSEDGRLLIWVEDGGSPFNADLELVKGVGLRNTKLRLQSFYENNFSFDVSSNEYSGTTVRISIPFIEFK